MTGISGPGKLQGWLLPAAGFALTAGFAVAEGWTLAEFCWSTWLAGLVFAYACVVTAVVEIPLVARRDLAAAAVKAPKLKLGRLSPGQRVAVVSLAGCAAGVLFYYLYSYLFAFYGLFLSVFAEMEPHAYFGRNGFINSDFHSPVAWLLVRFWPMAIGVLLANAALLGGSHPWKRLVLPFKTRQIVRLHMMVLLLPFLAMLAWALLGEAYQTLAVVLLVAVLYLIPAEAGRDQRAEKAP